MVMPPLATQPVVYLDQGHWINLARSIYSPSKIAPPSELAAATRVRELAASGAVRLVLSGTHVVETSRRAEVTSRRHLADTMISLYDGVFMLNPIAVRGEELRLALRGLDPTVSRDVVFSRDPEAPFTQSVELLYPQRTAEELNEERVIFEHVLRSGVVSSKDAEAATSAAESWARHADSIGKYIAANPATRSLELVAATYVFGDLDGELAQAAHHVGLSMNELSSMVNEETIVAFFTAMPMVGRTMKVALYKISNPEKRWERNDLMDVFGLSCTAGYADFVVAENLMAHQLRNAKRFLASGAQVVAKLADLVALLDPIGGENA